MTDNLLKVELNESSPVPSQKQQEELFSEVDKAKKTDKLVGFGLGLSLAKRITDVIGGNIGVYPGPENTTTYKFQLPSS
jgi:signal transduction histidine kinase